MTVEVLRGDCRERLRDLADNSVGSCVCDPPYELGFMGQGWDKSGVAYDVDVWREVLRVLKPGGHLAAFGGTRTYHRMTVAIEDAGFEIRDQLGWAYGSGFPKSHDISKTIDKAAGAEREVISERHTGWNGTLGGKGALSGLGDAEDVRRVTAPATDEAAEWDGWGTALKPAWEPICLARKPLSEKSIAANVLKWGTGALNIDGCRIEGQAQPFGNGTARRGGIMGESAERGAWEPTAQGRWPANLCHDGSDEVVAGFPDTESNSGKPFNKSGVNAVYGKYGAISSVGITDSGSAARFFYCAKAGKLDRLGSDHPTVKPVALMRWLVRMTTPPGGHVLDPFAGTGSTGIAAWVERFDAVLIELRAEAADDIERRLAYIRGQGRTKAVELAHNHDDAKKAKARGDDLPLFG